MKYAHVIDLTEINKNPAHNTCIRNSGGRGLPSLTVSHNAMPHIPI